MGAIVSLGKLPVLCPLTVIFHSGLTHAGNVEGLLTKLAPGTRRVTRTLLQPRTVLRQCQPSLTEG